MTEPNIVKEKILQNFPALSESDIRIDGTRVWVNALLPEEFAPLMEFAYNELKFNNFHITCGMDYGDHFEVVYVLTDEDNTMLNLRQRTVSREDTAIVSVFQYFENSLFHERELVDLFGIQVQGLPPGHRYPLPDKWPDGNYPLRKDWKPEFFDKKTLTYDKIAAEEAERKAQEEALRKAAERQAAIEAAKKRKAEKEEQA